MNSPEPRKVTRDCEVTQIPSGLKMFLPRGTEVVVTQSLGGSFTLMTEIGYLVRLEAKDADAIGEKVPVPEESSSAPPTAEALEKRIWEQMKTCYDPEIPVNIVDLGLIYSCKVLPREEGGNRVEVRMTLTAPGCGMGEILRADVQGKILSLPGVNEADVQMVYDPPWDRNRMSEAAKLQLGLL